ncbi:MAG: DUF4347 domain-containing protein [Epsilonproteobacteria bacterium]|nr:DUF4347 domain-containing protein [Campylobacterota bacterium]
MTKKILPAKKLKRPSVLIEVLEPRFMMAADLPGADVIIPTDNVQDITAEGDTLVENAQTTYEEETANSTIDVSNDTETTSMTEDAASTEDSPESEGTESKTNTTANDSESPEVEVLDETPETEETIDTELSGENTVLIQDDTVENTPTVETTDIELTVDEVVLVQDETSIDIVDDTSLLEVSDTTDEPRTELVLVNSDVTDYQELIDGLEPSDETRTIEVVVLDAEENGVEQVSEILSNYTDLDAIHVISHGSDGAFSLGDTWLENDDILENSEAISSWSDALSEDADILLYGCDVSLDSDGGNLNGYFGNLDRC